MMGQSESVKCEEGKDNYVWMVWMERGNVSVGWTKGILDLSSYLLGVYKKLMDARRKSPIQVDAICV